MEEPTVDWADAADNARKAVHENPEPTDEYVRALETHAAYCRRIARPGLADAIEAAAALYKAVWVPGGECYTMPDGECISQACDLHTPPLAASSVRSPDG